MSRGQGWRSSESPAPPPARRLCRTALKHMAEKVQLMRVQETAELHENVLAVMSDHRKLVRGSRDSGSSPSSDTASSDADSTETDSSEIDSSGAGSSRVRSITKGAVMDPGAQSQFIETVAAAAAAAAAAAVEDMFKQRESRALAAAATAAAGAARHAASAAASAVCACTAAAAAVEDMLKQLQLLHMIRRRVGELCYM